MGDEDCLQMWMNEGKWNDLKCDFTKVPQSTMCEKVLMKAPEKKPETTQSKSLKVQTSSNTFLSAPTDNNTRSPEHHSKAPS